MPGSQTQLTYTKVDANLYIEVLVVNPSAQSLIPWADLMDYELSEMNYKIFIEKITMFA